MSYGCRPCRNLSGYLNQNSSRSLSLTPVDNGMQSYPGGDVDYMIKQDAKYYDLQFSTFRDAQPVFAPLKTSVTNSRSVYIVLTPKPPPRHNAGMFLRAYPQCSRRSSETLRREIQMWKRKTSRVQVIDSICLRMVHRYSIGFIPDGIDKHGIHSNPECGITLVSAILARRFSP